MTKKTAINQEQNNIVDYTLLDENSEISLTNLIKLRQNSKQHQLALIKATQKLENS